MSNDFDHIEPTPSSGSHRSSRRLPPAHPPIEELELHRYLEGRLEGAAHQALEDALRVDAAARRTLDALREESRLIRQALEARSEPSRRLGDKVLATLHNEERFHLNALHNRRLRRQVFLVAGAAAAVMLCLWLVKPRDAAGSALSGTSATLATRSGERKPLQKGMRVYEGDQVATALGQFVRLSLGDVVLDIDENSKLAIEKGAPAPAVRLDAGRIGVDSTNSQQDVLIYLPHGSVRASRGGRFDLWLPNDAAAQWPELLEPAPRASSSSPLPASGEGARGWGAVVTVLRGYATVWNESMPAAETVTQSSQARWLAGKWSMRHVNLSASRVPQARHQPSWHSFDGTAPRERAAIGLLTPPDFATLGTRLNLSYEKGPIADALGQLHAAAQTAAPAARAEKLAAAQQALRTACETLKESDDPWHFGRMLEGLAHLDRGRALLSTGAARQASAHEAFDAARVAFEEALKEPLAPETVPPTPPGWTRAFTAQRTPRLEELSPVNQAALLASFLHPVALYWEAETTSSRDRESAEAEKARDLREKAAREFAALSQQLGHSVESLAARLAEGLALELPAVGDESAQRAGLDKATDAFLDVIGFSLDGTAPEARRQADGVKQAALLELVRLHVAAGETQKARQTAEDFSLLFPLDDAAPAAQEINRLVENSARK